MARVLLVDDDPDQLTTRTLVLEAAGHTVETARSAALAYERFCASAPEMVIMDLRLPRSEDGLGLIRRLRERSAAVRILVLSGWTPDLAGLPERGMIDGCLSKPVRSRQLLELIARLTLWLLALTAVAQVASAAQDFPFRLDRPAEVVGDLEMSSPGSDWSAPGREAALATVTLDGAGRQNVMLFSGAAPYRYSVFLGNVAPGEHRLRIERNARYSAPGSGLEIAGARFREFRPGDPYYPILANAPILYARADTIGRFTDIPLLVYAEKLEENGRPYLEYTILYSNEDGGTSTRALMARWGRTTDIDYGYRAWLAASGNVARGTIQGKDHKELEFRGAREGQHPLLIVSTDNNMVSDEGSSAIRYQLAPLPVDLSAHAREQVMDDHPITYRVMVQELLREGKLRPFGAVDGEKISDPRNYLCLEFRLANKATALAALVRRRDESVWRTSNLGRGDYAISRDGWARTTVELPPGTRPADLDEIGFQCLLVPDAKGKWPPSNPCRLEAVTKAFFLGVDYTPGPSVWSLPGPLTIPAGEIRAFALTRTSAP